MIYMYWQSSEKKTYSNSTLNWTKESFAYLTESFDKIAVIKLEKFTSFLVECFMTANHRHTNNADIPKIRQLKYFVRRQL